MYCTVTLESTALAGGEAGFSYKEYKGTPPVQGQPAVSRVMSVNTKGENVYIELKSGPGKLTNTGAITPNGPAVVEINVAFKLYEARRMAASVLAYLQAWDVLRMMVNQSRQAGISEPVPYLLSPASTESGDTPVQPAHSARAGAAPAVAEVGANGDRPVTRKGPVPRAAIATSSLNGEATPALAGVNGSPGVAETTGTEAAGEAKASPTPPTSAKSVALQYQDGTPVNAANTAEMQTFQRFLAERQATPQSRSVLQAYYRQLAVA